MTKILHVQTMPVQQNTQTGQWDNMLGLVLNIPPASNTEKVALVILDVPSPYALGTDFPGCNFALKVNGAILTTTPTASFSYSVQSLPASAGRMPTTLVARIPLGQQTTRVQAVWQAVRGSKGIVDAPCSLSAVLGEP